MRDVIEKHSYETASEFLDVLSPRCSATWQGEASKWIYRGQGDATWKLVPGAMRDISIFREFGVFSVRDSVADPLWARRKDLVEEMLEQFRRGLDRSGVVIPAVSPVVRPENLYGSDAEPHWDARPLMALAQHHGLPTQLLDWTRRAWVAAYFAAIQAVEHCKSEGYLAVWALCHCDIDERDDLRVYEAPGGTNPNLRAQSGLFTLLVRGDDMEIKGYVASQRGRPKLRRFSLPRSEAPNLLRELSVEGIDGASMFPGPDGVVKAMKERGLWQSLG